MSLIKIRKNYSFKYTHVKKRRKRGKIKIKKGKSSKTVFIYLKKNRKENFMKFLQNKKTKTKFIIIKIIIGYSKPMLLVSYFWKKNEIHHFSSQKYL